jgi:aspartyl-tRNA(Asn)/glutamyl-tRNA(Gln) amidotransferase subunit A
MTPFPTIAEAAALLAKREISPVELTRHCLDRIEKLEPLLNAFILQTPERALADARAAEARFMAGSPLGVLDGIPIAHKDIYGTAGIATTAHSRQLIDNVPSQDATTVAKLAAAGTVMLGKLATHEFAFGGPSFDLPWPPARNPWNRDHFTSGSSSGTGAGVAAGMFLGGTGSDTGGSIRGPAALCGVAGIKPTYGLCSRAGVLPLTYSMDHTGPLAWTVEDCAILLQAMAGYDPTDPASANRPVPSLTAELKKGVAGLRIGVVRHFHETDHKVDAPVQQAIDDAVALFRGQGAEIREVTLPSLFDFQACGFVILVTEAFALHEPWMQASREKYGELLRDRMAFGALVSGADYVQALRRRRELCTAVTAAMADVDILLTAGAPSEAPPIDNMPKWASLEKPGFTIPFNVTGQPAMTICAGFGPGGLPLGIQLAARPFDDATLLRACHAYEAATPWRSRRPAMAMAMAEAAAGG